MGYNRGVRPRDSLTIRIDPARQPAVEIVDAPPLNSSRKLIEKGLQVLRAATPGLMRYLSVQRALGNLERGPIIVCVPEGTAPDQVLFLLRRWLQGKVRRRLLYVVLELVLLPIAALAAVLPGPNVAFYLLIVLFYFHTKALLHLRRIKVERLPIAMRDPSGRECREAAGVEGSIPGA